MHIYVTDLGRLWDVRLSLDTGPRLSRLLFPYEEFKSVDLYELNLYGDILWIYLISSASRWVVPESTEVSWSVRMGDLSWNGLEICPLITSVNENCVYDIICTALYGLLNKWSAYLHTVYMQIMLFA